MRQPQWKHGALVLLWPNGDWPPILGTIVATSIGPSGVFPVVRTCYGESPCSPSIISSAAPLLRASAAGMHVPWGHC